MLYSWLFNKSELEIDLSLIISINLPTYDHKFAVLQWHQGIYYQLMGFVSMTKGDILPSIPH